jgi:hypothetical protein
MSTSTYNSVGLINIATAGFCNSCCRSGAVQLITLEYLRHIHDYKRVTQPNDSLISRYIQCHCLIAHSVHYIGLGLHPPTYNACLMVGLPREISPPAATCSFPLYKNTSRRYRNITIRLCCVTIPSPDRSGRTLDTRLTGVIGTTASCGSVSFITSSNASRRPQSS